MSTHTKSIKVTGWPALLIVAAILFILGVGLCEIASWVL